MPNEITEGIEDAVNQGLMEPVGVDGDGEFQYRLTEAGEKRVEAMIRANRN